MTKKHAKPAHRPAPRPVAVDIVDIDTPYIDTDPHGTAFAAGNPGIPTDQPDQPENGSADEVQAEEGKAAEPKPGDPEYDWTQHYPDGTELFRYTFPGGPTVALKAFGTIYSKTWLYKLRDIESDFEVEFAAIDRAICPTGRSLLMELDDANGDPIDDLWNAWIKAGTSRGGEDEGLTPGNSKSSPAQ